MILSDLIAALKARWKLELAIALFILVVIGIWTAVSPRTYVAASSLLFDDRVSDTIAQGGEVTATPAMLATQADIIRSEAVATRVVTDLKLAENPVAVARWRAATGGTGTVEQWMGRALLTKLEVAPGKASSVLTVSYASSDPQFSALIANSFASTYIDERLKMSTDPAKTYTRWFEERTREVRAKLEDAQAKLVAFQREKGIVDTGGIDAEANRLAALSGELTNAEGASADSRARSGASASGSPDVQYNGVVSGLRSQIASKAAQVSEMATIYGPNHPSLLAAKAELADLQTKLNAEIGTSTTALRVASGVAASREGSLRGLLNSQRDRMLELSQDRSQLEVLARDVTSARQAYDSVTQRLSAMRLQTDLPSTNARLLDQAVPPLLPSSPNIPLRAFLGVLLGALAGASIAAALEWLRPRVRTGAGLASVTGVPVLTRIDFGRSAILPLLEAGAR